MYLNNTIQLFLTFYIQIKSLEPASKIRIVPDDDDESRASDTPAPTELAPTEVARTATSDESQGAAAPAKVAFGALLGDEGDAGGFSSRSQVWHEGGELFEEEGDLGGGVAEE